MVFPLRRGVQLQDGIGGGGEIKTWGDGRPLQTNRTLGVTVGKWWSFQVERGRGPAGWEKHGAETSACIPV